MDLLTELQVRLNKHSPADVDELILDDVFTNIVEFSESNKVDLESYTSLIYLSMNGFGLRNLNNFPNIETLQVLEIRGNKLDGSDLESINSCFPNLYKLKLGDNPIKSYEVFRKLQNSSIKKIELHGTNICENERYREEIFKILPGLELIDNKTLMGDDISTTNYDENEDEDENEIENEDVEVDEEEIAEEDEKFKKK